MVFEPGTDGLGRVAGSVCDRKTGGPLWGAAVEIWNTDFGSITDEDGRYIIEEVLHPGRYTLVASCVGYWGDSALVEVKPGSTTVIDFRLRPTEVDIRLGPDVPESKH